ncbi:SurA N-terminal domain-containing protein [Terriglobus sp.]|uniref:SurA N-terminal domain-containing protein n=1 Tax=Terriglobus sp. TaxID=1889013 RepID=UPI003B009134
MQSKLQRWTRHDTISPVTLEQHPHPGRTFRHFLVVVAVSCSVLALAGCPKKHGDDVVASVNGHAIPRADLDRLFDAQQKNKQDPTPESQEQADSERLEMVRGLIDQEIVEQRAAKMNLTATNDEVDAKIAELKSHGTDQDFNEYLKQSNQTLDDLRRNVRRSVTSTKLFNKEIESKINVTDAEVTNYFNAHKAEYNLIENRYHLAQILVTSLPLDPTAAAQGQANLQGSKATNEAEARKKIQTIKNRIDAGEDFGTLAANYSENPQTASNGGDMGFPSESQLRADPQTFAAISKLKAGEATDILPVYGPTKQVIGYVILKLLSRESAGQRDLTSPAVQQSIRDQLRNSRSQLLKNAYLEMVRDQAKVENYLADSIFNKGAK